MNLDKILEMYKTLPELSPSMMEETRDHYKTSNSNWNIYWNICIPIYAKVPTPMAEMSEYLPIGIFIPLSIAYQYQQP